MHSETIEVYAFICKGIAGAPENQHGIHVTGDPNDTPKPLTDRTADGLAQAGFCYWALSAAGYDEFPPILMHVYFEGAMPGETERDYLNQAVKYIAGQLLFS